MLANSNVETGLPVSIHPCRLSFGRVHTAGQSGYACDRQRYVKVRSFGQMSAPARIRINDTQQIRSRYVQHRMEYTRSIVCLCVCVYNSLQTDRRNAHCYVQRKRKARVVVG